jgi:hypothetical protein
MPTISDVGRPLFSFVYDRHFWVFFQVWYKWVDIEGAKVFA